MGYNPKRSLPINAKALKMVYGRHCPSRFTFIALGLHKLPSKANKEDLSFKVKQVVTDDSRI
jgi:hypothetical protein